MNPRLKNICLSLLSFGGAFKLGRWLHRKGLTVVTYHRVLPDRSIQAGYHPKDSYFSGEFEWQIRYFATNYHVVSGGEFLGFLFGRLKLPDRSVFITFDDGFENNYNEAFPILKKYGITATFFITTAHIGPNDSPLWLDRLDQVLDVISWVDAATCLHEDRLSGVRFENKQSFREWLKRQKRAKLEKIVSGLERRFEFCVSGHRSGNTAVWRMMNWDQVREMDNEGMTIGSHTKNHQILSCASSEEVQYELLGSKSKIEQEIGRPCWCFSYPNGTAVDFRFSDKIAIKNAGYACSFTQLPGFIGPKYDAYTLPRISLSESSDQRVFQSKLSGLHGIFRRLMK